MVYASLGQPNSRLARVLVCPLGKAALGCGLSGTGTHGMLGLMVQGQAGGLWHRSA